MKYNNPFGLLFKLWSSLFYTLCFHSLVELTAEKIASFFFSFFSIENLRWIVFAPPLLLSLHQAHCHFYCYNWAGQWPTSKFSNGCSLLLWTVVRHTNKHKTTKLRNITNEFQRQQFNCWCFHTGQETLPTNQRTAISENMKHCQRGNIVQPRLLPLFRMIISLPWSHVQYWSI